MIFITVVMRPMIAFTSFVTPVMFFSLLPWLITTKVTVVVGPLGLCYVFFKDLILQKLYVCIYIPKCFI